MSTDKLTPEHFAKAERLHEAATPAPWASDIWANFDEGGYAAIGPHHKQEEDDDDFEPSSACGNKAKQDADFIAFFRNHGPQAFRELAETRAKLAESERIFGVAESHIAHLQDEGDALRAKLAQAEAERDDARAREATCHCGLLISQHGTRSECSFVENKELCPHAEQIIELRAALKSLLVFHPEDLETGADLPKEYWQPAYRNAVEVATAALSARKGAK